MDDALDYSQQTSEIERMIFFQLLRQVEHVMNKKLWHRWYSPVVNRRPTYSEAFVAYFFEFMGVKYRREFVIDHYPVDFALPALRLVVEVDSPCCRGKGGKNSKKKRADAKDEYLQKRGWEVYRLRWVRGALTFNKEITRQNFQRMLDCIRARQDALLISPIEGKSEYATR